jgi:hypothetical protein
MTKWEYLVEKYELSFFNQKPTEQKLVFDKLGLDGWELISAVPIARTGIVSIPETKAITAYFKREIRK